MFLEFTRKDGGKRLLIRADQILGVDDTNDGTHLYCSGPYHIAVVESYTTIRRRLQGAAGEKGEVSNG